MNKRLEKLWDQANTRWTCDYKLSGKPREEWRSVPDLFAELIVRECASKVDWIYAEKGITIDGVNFTVTQGDLIKQHFGVEE